MANKMIIVGGYCAAGKSTFSRKLANRYGIPCFNKDTIKEVIGEGFGIENKDVHQKNSGVTFSLMLHIAEQFLQTGNVCILESNFKKPESEQLKRLLEKYDCECLTFLFKGDLCTLYDRYAERDRSKARHWVHTTAGEDRDAFIDGHLQSGLGDIQIGQTVIVDATDFDRVDFEELYSLAERFLA